jgi:CRP/FNR family cyclic AMP-dependent transcriptional regulator
MRVQPTPQDEITISKGTVIFHQGDPGDQMFVIARGRVRLTLGVGGHQKEIGTFGPGEFLGELSLLSDAPRTATAEAVEDSTLLAISRDVFAMMTQDDLEIVFRMMSIQGQRLSQTNLPLQDLTKRMDCVRIVAHCLRQLWAAEANCPVMISLPDLTAQLGLKAEAVFGAVTDLAQRGIGSLADDRWTITDRGEIGRLLDVLCSYAAG